MKKNISACKNPYQIINIFPANEITIIRKYIDKNIENISTTNTIPQKYQREPRTYFQSPLTTSSINLNRSKIVPQTEQ